MEPPDLTNLCQKNNKTAPMEKTFIIEITGEGLSYNHMILNGISGKDYVFWRNPKTNSYARAYRQFEDYLAERKDLHRPNGVWALEANFVDSENVAKECFTKPAPSVVQKVDPSDDNDGSSIPTPKRRGRPAKIADESI